jgi:sugar lactone lactonase YvrE
MRSIAIIALVVAVLLNAILSASSEVLPNLVVSGFSWAENLVFDGYGSLFVSDAVRGEIWRINLCNDGTEYCHRLQLTDGLRSAGGMQVSPDGKTIYVGATLDDKTHVLISTEANPVGKASFKVLGQTKYQPNGVAADWSKNMLYYTVEGKSDDPGALMRFDLTTNTEITAYPGLSGADGAWFDAASNLLYVGLLTDKKIMVFNTTAGAGAENFLVSEYPGLSSLDKTHLLDDLTLFDATQGLSSSTVLLGADWLRSAVQKFNLAGTEISSIPPPAGIDSFHEITSVRWGKGPGFDPNSIYVTEGGGLLPRQTDRRVIQIKMI